MKPGATIKSGGKEYPCFPTMGAMLRFERMTGRPFTESTGSIQEALERLYCLAVSACESAGHEKPGPIQEFCDGILPEDFNAWAMSQESGGEDPDGKKA